MRISFFTLRYKFLSYDSAFIENQIAGPKPSFLSITLIEVIKVLFFKEIEQYQPPIKQH